MNDLFIHKFLNRPVYCPYRAAKMCCDLRPGEGDTDGIDGTGVWITIAVFRMCAVIYSLCHLFFQKDQHAGAVVRKKVLALELGLGYQLVMIMRLLRKRAWESLRSQVIYSAAGITRQRESSSVVSVTRRGCFSVKIRNHQLCPVPLFL